jgi:hypothetical protein
MVVELGKAPFETFPEGRARAGGVANSEDDEVAFKGGGSAVSVQRMGHGARSLLGVVFMLDERIIGYGIRSVKTINGVRMCTHL